MENQNKACKRTSATIHSYQSRTFRASQVLVSAIRDQKPAREALWECLKTLDPMLYRMMNNGEWNEALDLANVEVEAIESEPLPSFQKLLADGMDFAKREREKIRHDCGLTGRNLNDPPCPACRAEEDARRGHKYK